MSINSSQRPTAKRSPSILVTDARSHVVNGVRAPFAGHNYRKQQQLQQQQSLHGSHQQPNLHYSFRRKLASRANKYTDISVDKLLSNSSDIPSGQSRLPLLNQGSGHFSPPQRSLSPNPLEQVIAPDQRRRNIRSIPKLSQSLPIRTSKTSQRLVLIPDEYGATPTVRLESSLQGSDAKIAEVPPQTYRSRAELMLKEARAKELSRVTAYFICEEFNLDALLDFLKKNHEVKPRLYDEALYVPYALPLLPGTDGFRVKSNDSAKSLSSKRLVENMINKSEQRNHLYEYYSGVETPEDANNYSMDPEEGTSENSGPFDPSEPQFFAPPLLASDSHSGSNESFQTQKSSDSLDREDEESSAQSKHKPRDSKSSSSMDQTELTKHHGEMFVLRYGIVVFWNLSETHEKNILADLAFASQTPEPLLINPISEQDIETEEFHFEYDPQISRPRIYNDMITLRSGDHLIKLTMSYAIAQLTKLCLFESRMVHSLLLISKLPKKLALTGRLGLKRQQILKKSGKLFKLRVDVNLSSSILDTPDFFWSIEPALHPLYTAVREYLEIEQRVQVLNDRCKVFLEFSNIISDSINESSTTRITMMIIIIIFLSLAVSVFEFVLDIL